MCIFILFVLAEEKKESIKIEGNNTTELFEFDDRIQNENKNQNE